MSTAKRVGRIIGVFLLVQFAGGVLVNFVLTEPAFQAPGFLVNAAGHRLEIALAVLIGLADSLLLVAIAVAAYETFRQYSRTLALGFVALAVACCAVNAIENVNLMSMLSLSEAYAKATADAQPLFQALRGVVAAARNWAHYIGLILSGCTLLVFYSVLCRFALVPRLLAGFGVGAVALQLFAVAMPLFGHDIVFLMLMPLGLAHLTLAVWLLARGLSASDPPGTV